MKRIYIEAGHNLTDPGAVGNGFREADLTRKLRNSITAELRDLEPNLTIIHDSDSQTLAQVIQSFKPDADDWLLSIHFNAGASTATGAEVLYKVGAPKAVIDKASELSALTASVLKIRNRGAKSEASSARGRLGILHEPCNCLLIEVCFITNKTDIVSYANNSLSLSKQIAEFLSKL